MQIRILLFAASLCACGNAASSPITFYFHGTVVSIGSEVDDGTVSLGDTVSGSFTFESTTTDILPANPGFGRYLNAIDSVFFSFGDYSGSLAPGKFAHIDVLNDANPFPRDAYNISPFSMDNSVLGGAVAGNELDFFRFQLNDPTGTVFSNDLLPLTPPDVSAFTQDSGMTTYLLLQFADGASLGQSRQVRADFTYLETSPFAAAPTPGSLLLILLGLPLVIRPLRICRNTLPLKRIFSPTI